MLVFLSATYRKEKCMKNEQKMEQETYVSQVLLEDYSFNLSDFALFLAVMKNREPISVP